MRDTNRPYGPPAVIWVLTGLVVASTGIAAFLIQPPPPEVYRATVVVSPPTMVRDTPGGVNLFVADLPEIATSDPMVVHVLDRVPGLRPEEYVEGVTASRRGSTSLVAVSFVHKDRLMARLTVEAVSTRLLDETARDEFDRSAFLLESARERLTAAQDDLHRFAQDEGIFDAETEYRMVIEEIAFVKREITAASIEDPEEPSIEVLEDRHSVLLQERERLGSALLRYEILVAELDRAQDEVEVASTRYAAAEFEYTTVNTSENLIVSRDVVLFSDDSERLQQTALVAVAALVLSLLTLVPLGFWLAHRRIRGRHSDSAEDGTPIYDGYPESEIDLSYEVSGRVYDHR
jgi:hypothetical protein